jgi:hypothetical protein
MNQIKKNQHWVSQYYLKQFANSENKLSVYDTMTHKVFTKLKSTKSICSADFFYSTQTGINDEFNQDIENALSEMEGGFADEYSDFCSQIINLNISPHLIKKRLSYHISTLYLRSEYYRNMLNKTESKLMREIAEKRFSYNRKEFFIKTEEKIGKPLTDEEKDFIKETIETKKYEINHDNSIHLLMMGKYKTFASLINIKPWKVLYIPDNLDLKFITSDTPIIEKFPIKEGVYGTPFSQRTQYFTLSKKILIEMKPVGTQGKTIKRKEIIDRRIVDELNILRLELSSKYAYSEKKDDFLFAKEYVELRNKYEQLKLEYGLNRHFYQ